MTNVFQQGWSKWEPGDVNPEAKNKPRDICPVKKGYGMGVVSISPIVGASLHSVVDKLSKVIPTTLDENRYLSSLHFMQHVLDDCI
jgi:hypothetical protein